MPHSSTSWWRNRTRLTFVGFLLIGAYFLWTEHRAHVIEFLPWIFILGCFGMHLFMHAGHGHAEHHQENDDHDDAEGTRQ